jgi:transcriptional regulator with XRE-family HTH domain
MSLSVPPSDTLRNLLRVRLGTALYKKRLERRLTQVELAEMADLSVKYLGEIERGEANATLEALEAIARALEWDPMVAIEGPHEPVSEGVRVLLMAEVRTTVDRFKTMLQWLEALDPALRSLAHLAVPRICMGHPVLVDAAGNLIPVGPTVPPPAPPAPEKASAPDRLRRRVRRRVVDASKGGAR